MALIYIVEDDASIREIETIALKNSNYIVRSFGCAADFYKKTDEILPDLVLLDIMLPDQSGFEIVRKLRKEPKTRRIPVIMVTAKTSEADMVKGLDDGADDYIRKPFSVLELLSRVKALLRRTEEETADHLCAGGIELDHSRRLVRANGKPVELTFKEYELLRYLRRMQQYRGGKEVVERLCRNWILAYPTRKVMVSELGKVLRGLGQM